MVGKTAKKTNEQLQSNYPPPSQHPPERIRLFPVRIVFHYYRRKGPEMFVRGNN